MSESRYHLFARKKTDPTRETENLTLYQKLGGAVTVGQAVDIFYRKVMRDARINYFFFGVNVTEQAEKQKAFLSMVFGGPHHYTGRDMRHSHAKLVAMGMNDRHFNLVMDHLQASLTELQIEDPLIQEVLAIAESTREDVMGRSAVNQNPGTRGAPPNPSQGHLQNRPKAAPITGGQPPAHAPGTVGSIMSGRIITVQARMPIQDAMGIFAQSELHAIPVLNDQGQLVGILTANDLIKDAIA